MIRSVFPNRDDHADACSTWAEDGMTEDMYLLGSVLLHEYAYVNLPARSDLAYQFLIFLDTGIGFLEVSMVAP